MPILVAQMGHCYRTSGATGTNGEQQFATAVANACIALLNGRGGWAVRKILADEGSASYRGDAFVAVHCDGSTSSSARGASVGYRTPEGQALGQAWKRAYAARGWPGFRPDNYTAALANYYGTGTAVSVGNRRAVIIECGFLTNPEDRALLISAGGAERVALAIGDALGIPTGSPVGGFLMALTDQQQSDLYNAVMGLNRVIGAYYTASGGKQIGRGVYEMEQALGAALAVTGKPIGQLVAELYGRPGADVDEKAVAEFLAPLLQTNLGQIPDEQFTELVDAINDENDRRARTRASQEV